MVDESPTRPSRQSSRLAPRDEAASRRDEEAASRPARWLPKNAAALDRWRSGRLRRGLAAVGVILACLCLFGSATAQDVPYRPYPQNTPNATRPPETPNQPLSIEVPEGLAGGPKQWASPEGLSSTIQVMLLLTVLSLAPAVLLMTTCFVRIIVVLGLLRQAIGTQQLPPSQVVTTLALFMTLLIMSPVWKQVYNEAVVPYTEKQIDLEQTWTAGITPIRRFMSMQIARTGNEEDVYMFWEYTLDKDEQIDYEKVYFEDVPLQALLPAFMLSELKTAFLIGFQIYLPFLILDMVVAAVMVSMGMLMLPPILISLPFKLLLFVLVDGWHLVVGMLMESFQVFT
ncbi:MAG TPA: flagellar type III secretion system pore protein FliP [Thermoguttaceae bacterium]|nr:flagellar type III secretion system pore protein FliP [Thermoguttaceae bacterium]